MTRPSCPRCESDNHEACDGGAWDEHYKPVICECFLLGHHDAKPARKSTADLFAGRYLPDANGCWIWQGAIGKNGYGRVRQQGAHRVSYELHRGPIPAGLVIDHLCRNTKCVNPEHLEAVTHRVNVLRGIGPSARHAVATHCPSGHEYDGGNTYWTPAGKRQCRVCHRAREAAARKKRKSHV